jgi:hypothetical protein
MKLDQTINLGLGALSLLLLAACDSPPNRQKFADITFQHRPAISLDVGSVQIEAMPAVGLSAGTEDVSAEFPQAPAAAVNQWVRDRLRAVGVRGQADVTIIEARATRTPLPRSSGLDAALRKEQSDRYDLALEVRINAFNPVQGVTGSLTERVTRSQTVLEDLTLNQREAVLYNMLDAAMKDLDARLEQGIRQHLGPLIR